VDLFAAECDSCGVIFAKWEAAHPEAAAPPPAGGDGVPPAPTGDASAPPADPEPAPSVPPDGLPPLPPASEQILQETVRASSGRGLYILLGIVAFFIVGWLVWVLSTGSTGGVVRRSGPGASHGGLCPDLGTGDEFERVVPVPGEPQGLAWNGSEFLYGNRVKPWGFVRLTCDGRITPIPVKDPLQGQTINFWCLVFNGTEYVSYTDGRWVQSSSPDAFIVHDPSGLAILRHFPAPPKIGGLAWDGTNYWAGTRKNTQEEAGESWLYQLDDRFNVVQRWEAPVSGCQGLCWVNGTLYWVDVFTDQIVLLRPDGDRLVKLHAYEDATNYLSGIVFDGESLWVSEYQTNRLRMLPKRLTDAWFAGDYRVSNYMACKIARVLLAYESGNEAAFNTIMAYAGKGIPSPEELHVVCDALDSLGVRGPMVAAMDAVLANPGLANLHSVVSAEREKWAAAPPPQAAPAEPDPEAPTVEAPPSAPTASPAGTPSPSDAASTPTPGT
jgi:hypothetical protein